MRNPVCCILLFFLFSISINAQLNVKDNDEPANTIMQVVDEGTAGSILLPRLTGSLTGDKLYNNSGSLYWGLNKLGFAGNAGGWTDDGSVVHTTTSADKVGIGTSSPSASLQVSGNDGVLFTGTYDSGIIPIEGGGTRMMWYPKRAAFRVGRVSGVYSNFWDDDRIGNYSVAMGLNTPASGAGSLAMGFDARAEGNYSTAIGEYPNAEGHASTANGIRTSANAYNSFAIGSYNLGGGDPDSWVSTDPLFEIGNGTLESSSNALTVLKNGKVGIGFHEPAHKLHIHENSSSFSYLKITNDATGTASSDGVLIGLDADEDVRIHSNENNNVKFFINNSEKVRINNTGNMGIGTPTPARPLSFNDGYGDKISIWGQTTNANCVGIGNQAGLFQLYTDGSHADIVFGYGRSANFTENMRIEGDGNVGIGTSSPDYKLEVYGDAAKTSGTTWINSSDARLKDIHGNYAKGLEEIITLKPKRFSYKKDNPRNLPSETEEIGFIAQDVQKIFPEAVSEGKDGYLDFNMHAINVAMVNAIKEQQKIIEKLKEEIIELKKKIESPRISSQ